jgi:hypothetical protein
MPQSEAGFEPKSDGFFHALQRYFINGRLPDVARLKVGGDGRAACERWLTAKERRWVVPAGEQMGMTGKLGKVGKPMGDWGNDPDFGPMLLQAIRPFVAIILGSAHFSLHAAESNRTYLADPPPTTTALPIYPDPFLIKPKTYSPYDRLDAVIGQAIHDAVRVRDGRPPNPEIARNETLHVLYRTVEDAVLDAIVGLEYPGYEPYLLKYRLFYVDATIRGRWGTIKESRLNQAILAVRSVSQAKIDRKSVRHAYYYMLYLLGRHYSLPQLRKLDCNDAAKELYDILYSEKVYAHWGLVNHRSERFVFGPDGPAVEGDNGHNVGGDDGERQLAPYSHRLFQQIAEEVLGEESDIEEDDVEMGVLRDFEETCGAAREPVEPAGKPDLSEISIEAHDIVPETAGGGSASTYKTRLYIPPMYHQAEQRYSEAVRDVQPYITSLRKKFVPLKTKTSLRQHDLREGNLDEDALYKVRYSNKLFTKRMEAMRPTQLDVALLIDVSSSMKEMMDSGDGGSGIPRYIAAQRLTALFVEALERVDSAQSWVYSFASQEQMVDIRQLYSPAFHGHKARIGDIIPLPGRQTPEYAALSTVLRQFRQEARERSQKAIIVFSDGVPDDDVLSVQEQGEQIRKLAVREQKAGNYIVHVSMGPSAHADGIYPHSIAFPPNGYPELVVRFGRMLQSWVAQSS